MKKVPENGLQQFHWVSKGRMVPEMNEAWGKKKKKQKKKKKKSKE